MARNKTSKFGVSDGIVFAEETKDATLIREVETQKPLSDEETHNTAPAAADTSMETSATAGSTSKLNLSLKPKRKERGATKSIYFKYETLNYLNSFGDDFVFSDLVNQIILSYAEEHPVR